jgi:hypothetical protein
LDWSSSVRVLLQWLASVTPPPHSLFTLPSMKLECSSESEHSGESDRGSRARGSGMCFAIIGSLRGMSLVLLKLPAELTSSRKGFAWIGLPVRKSSPSVKSSILSCHDMDAVVLSIVAEDRLREVGVLTTRKLQRARWLPRLASLRRRALLSSVQTVDGVSSKIWISEGFIVEVGWHVCVFRATFLVAFCSRATHELRLEIVISRVKVIEGISRTVTGCW